MMKNNSAINNLRQIPGVGKSIAIDLVNIGINSVEDLKNENPDNLYNLSNKFEGEIQDRCLLYVFRCAVYYANTESGNRNPELLKWWNHKDFR